MQMREWITPSLEEDFNKLSGRWSLAFFSEESEEALEDRRKVFKMGCLIPGLRGCERKRVLVLAQSAPAVEIARLSEALEKLEREFEVYWEDMEEKERDKVLDRGREQLRQLYDFVKHVSLIEKRREDAKAEAARLLEEGFGERPREPVFEFLGYEVEVLLPALRSVSFPEALRSEKVGLRR